MDVLKAGALFEPELSLAVRTAHIAVSAKIPDPHISALEEVGDCVQKIGEAAVLIHPPVDILGQRAKKHQSQQEQDDHDQYGIADKEVDDIQQPRKDEDRAVHLVHPVSPLHEFSGPSEEISHAITRFKLYLIISNKVFQGINSFCLLNIY